MPLTSSSTDAEVEAAYDDNATWFEDASVTKARAFVTACLILERRLNDQVMKGNHMVQKRVEGIRMARKECQEWLQVNDDTRSGPRVIYGALDEERGT